MPTEPALTKGEFDQLHGLAPKGPKPPVYRIQIERDGNWGESEYVWKVFAWDSEEVLWEGISEWSRKSAERQAKRAVKKLRKGKTQPQPVTYPYDLYIYP